MEAKLTELVERLKAAASSNLSAVVLFGSAVTGEFQAKHSNLNILCILAQAGATELERLHPVAEWWMREGNPPPIVFTFDELRRSGDIFAIELWDMKQYHRMLFGVDFFDAFPVPLQLHRLQVERELRSGWMRLRQAVLGAPQESKSYLGIMLASVSTFGTLFRHALMAMGQPAVAGKREAVNHIAALVGADPSGFDAVLDLREGTRKEKDVDVEAALQAYVTLVGVVTDEVDRRLELN